MTSFPPHGTAPETFGCIPPFRSVSDPLFVQCTRTRMRCKWCSGETNWQCSLCGVPLHVKCFGSFRTLNNNLTHNP